MVVNEHSNVGLNSWSALIKGDSEPGQAENTSGARKVRYPCPLCGALACRLIRSRAAYSKKKTKSFARELDMECDHCKEKPRAVLMAGEQYEILDGALESVDFFASRVALKMKSMKSS